VQIEFFSWPVVGFVWLVKLMHILCFVNLLGLEFDKITFWFDSTEINEYQQLIFIDKGFN